MGMQNATGDVVVIINGDVRPEKDFLTRLAGHYRDGAEWAVCTSRAVNIENIWARYIHAMELEYKHRSKSWSEGFSCLRSAADRIGYIPGDFPIPFCRDYMIGERLEAAGYRKHEAHEIIMSHIAHDTFAEFWGVRVNRGSWSPINRLCFKTYTPGVIVARELLKTVRYVFLAVTLLYHVVWACRYSRHVGFANLPAFLVISLLEQTAFTVGNFKGLRKMFRFLRENQAARPETV
jgi:GT2 family glycosyltransferase